MAKTRTIIMLLLIMGLSGALGAEAAGLVPDCGGEPCVRICQVAQLGKNILNFLTGIIVPAAVAVTAYGGFLIMFSGGSPQKVQDGRKAIRAAVLGIIIAFTAWVGINILIQLLTGGQPFNWSTIPC